MITDNYIRIEKNLEGGKGLHNQWRWYGLHQNDVENGEALISITQIMNIAVSEKLKNYFVNNSKNAQEKRLKETADIGKRIHKLIEDDLKGLEPVPDEDCKKAFDKWGEMQSAHSISADHNEILLFSKKLGFAGTADIIGSFETCDSPSCCIKNIQNDDGSWRKEKNDFHGKCVMDLKTGFYDIKAGWQMAAYRQCFKEMYGEDLGMVGLNVKRDGSVATPFIYEHFKWCLKSFLACLEVWKALYFSTLQKINWKYLHVNSLEILNEIEN